MSPARRISSFGSLGIDYGEQEANPPDHHHVGPWAVFQAFERDRDTEDDRETAARAMRYFSVDPSSSREYLRAVGRRALDAARGVRERGERLDDVALFVRVLGECAAHLPLLAHPHSLVGSEIELERELGIPSSPPPLDGWVTGRAANSVGGAADDLKTSGVRERDADEGRRGAPPALLHPIAAGSLGEVHLLWRREPGSEGRWMAVKLLDPHFVEDEAHFEQRLLELTLRSPNLCTARELSEHEGCPSVIMDYQHGVSLAHVARYAAPLGGLPPHLAVAIVLEAARGLATAHAHHDSWGTHRPIVHRDLSPQSLMVLYEGVTRVLGFGVPRPMEESSGFTRRGLYQGRPGYMAPEQLRGHALHPGVDVWALGVVLWEALAGRRLFTRATEVDTIANVLNAPAPRPSSVRREVSPALDEVVLRALDRDPERRHRDAGELAADLERARSADTWAGSEAVAHYLQTHFAADRSLRDALLHDLLAQVDLSDDQPSAVPLFDEDAVTPALPRALTLPILPTRAPTAARPVSPVSGAQVRGAVATTPTVRVRPAR